MSKKGPRRGISMAMQHNVVGEILTNVARGVTYKNIPSFMSGKYPYIVPGDWAKLVSNARGAAEAADLVLRGPYTAKQIQQFAPTVRNQVRRYQYGVWVQYKIGSGQAAFEYTVWAPVNSSKTITADEVRELAAETSEAIVHHIGTTNEKFRTYVLMTQRLQQVTFNPQPPSRP